MDKTTVLCAVVVCLLPVVLGQQDTFRWSIQKYPDPFSYDTYSQCGRSNKSNICDPNRILPKHEADEIDSLIWSVLRETRCSCPSCIRNRQGYVIRVAVMPRMESIYGEGNSSTAMLKDARMFAYLLTKKWAMEGDCSESLLVLYSRYDGILYTLTLPEARRVLDDESVKRITISVRPLFDDEQTVGKGLKEMIMRYKLMFDGNEKEALRPRMSSQRGSSATTISPSFFVSLLLSGLFIAAIH